MAKRDTNDEPLTSLQQALQAVDDNGENPFVGGTHDFVGTEGDTVYPTAAVDEFADKFQALAAKTDDNGEYVFKTPEAVASATDEFIRDQEHQRKSAKLFGFGAIPATDHDTLTAQEAAEKIVKGEPLVSAVDQITTTRATTHGRYRDTARISQSLKRVVHMELDDRLARGQPDLTDQQLESIDLICTKLARIFSGDSSLAEHWQDVSGYAQIAIEDK